jgi:hypothetical protein
MYCLKKDLKQLSPVTKKSVELDKSMLLIRAEPSPLYVGSQIIDPPKSTALPAPLQPYSNEQDNHINTRKKKAYNPSQEAQLYIYAS